MTITLLAGEAVVDGALETITRSDTGGSWITDGFRIGQLVSITGFVNSENNDTNFTITDVNTAVLTLDADLISETSTFPTTYAITQSSISPQSTTTLGVTIDALRASNGSSALPSISFKNQPDMGLYIKRQDGGVPIPGNHLHFSADGSRVFRILRDGTLRVNSGYFGKVLIKNDIPNKQYVDRWNFNTQTGTTYTLIFTGNAALPDDGDLNKIVSLDNGAAITLTVPDNATADFPIGSRVMLLQQDFGTVTVSPDVGVIIQSLGGSTSITGRFGMAMLVKVGTDTWNLSGDI
jgi:hypothetical protein